MTYLPTKERLDTAGVTETLTSSAAPAVPSTATIVGAVLTAAVVILMSAAICEALGPRLGPAPDPGRDAMHWLYAVGLVLLGAGTGLHTMGT